MQKIILLITCSSLVFFSCGQEVDSSAAQFDPATTRSSYLLGSTAVEVIIQQYGDRNDIVMLNLHDDETTSVEAAQRVLAQTGGILIRIDNGNKRLITFTLNGSNYLFDPNRMFSTAGIEATLLKHTKTTTPAAIRAIQGFADFVLNKIPRANGTLVTLHNNDEGRLSIDSYGPGGDYEKDVEKWAKARGMDPDNFFLTTNKHLYKELKDSFNTVLQQNRKAKDDGSLSIYYGRRNKSYVNVEAEIGQVQEQERMIRFLLRQSIDN